MDAHRTVPLTVGSLVGAVLVTGTLLLPSAPGVDFSHCVEITVVSSTEKDHLITELAEQYNDAHRVADQWCGEIEVNAVSSGAASEQLQHGWDEQATGSRRPDIWLPSTSLWAGLLEYRTGRDLVSGEDDSITTSPLVIAMPEKMARALGWPEKSLGWSDLRELAATRDWSRYGHPEWGHFAMGKDNPRLSSSGLAATIATYYAATRDIGGFTEQNLSANADVLKFVRDIESSVTHYSDDSVAFLEKLSISYPEPVISAMAIQEQMVYLYNTGGLAGDAPSSSGDGPVDPLVAIHPDDGTVLVDHPFLVLRDVDEAKRAVANDFRDFLLSEEAQRKFSEEGFRDHEGGIDDEVARVVNSEGRNSPEPRPIDPPSAAQVEHMLRAWEDARRRGSVLLLLDVSKSMTELADPGATEPQSKWELLEPAVLRGLELLDDDDEVALWTFSEDPNVHEVMPMSPVKQVREELTQRVSDALRVRGDRTALYKATYRAHEAMRANLDVERINAIVLLTDGHDTTHDMSLDELLQAIDPEYLDSSVRIFTISYGKDADRDTLSEIAATSQARHYDARDPHEIDQVFLSAFSNF